jgi:hypothetical protein
MPNKPRWPHAGTTILTPNPNGQWSKKHRGRVYYFGVWADPDAALKRWEREWPAIRAGAVAEVRNPDVLVTLKDVTDALLDAKLVLVERGDLARVTYRKYSLYVRRVLEVLGHARAISAIGPRDFEKLHADSAKLGVYGRSDYIVFVRHLFVWGHKARGCPVPNFGPGFAGVPARDKREHRNTLGDTSIDAAQFWALVDASDNPQMTAALWLGLNGGYGNTDVGTIEASMIHGDMIDCVRHKTRVKRRVPLWPETVAALRALPRRPDNPLLFQTATGLPWVRPGTDAIGKTFPALAASAGVACSFRDLRRTFATVARQANNVDASKIIMGQVIEGVHDLYVQRFPVEQLRAVSAHVYGWVRASRGGRRRAPARGGAGASA